MEGGLTMAALAFVLGMAGLFFALLAYETSGDATQARLNPPGLLTWLASGNWPAKVGAALLIVGIGALIRYLLLALQVPPEVKTGTGVAAAALLAALSFRIRQRPDRRALHFALTGTARLTSSNCAHGYSAGGSRRPRQAGIGGRAASGQAGRFSGMEGCIEACSGPASVECIGGYAGTDDIRAVGRLCGAGPHDFPGRFVWGQFGCFHCAERRTPASGQPGSFGRIRLEYDDMRRCDMPLAACGSVYG